MDRHGIGPRGEAAAAAYLERQGLVVLARNWRCALGEIDIVAAEGDTLVVCEVRTRTGSAFGSPEESVTRDKRRRLVRLARALAGDPSARDVRFDVVTVSVHGHRATLRHHRAAFDAGT